MQRDSSIEISNITATMHIFFPGIFKLYIHLLLVKTDKKHAILVDLIDDAKVFVTSMTSLGPCLVLRGRNMAEQ